MMTFNSFLEVSMAEHSHDQHSSGGGAGRWVFWGFLLIAAYFLIIEHRAHVFQFLPFLLLLACPLLHMFHGHGSHGGHAGGDASGESADTQKSRRPSDSALGSKDPGSEQHHHH